MTAQELAESPDPRLQKLETFAPLAAARTAHLLLQAAHREGMLGECQWQQEGDSMIWSRHGYELRVVGQALCDGDRLSLDYSRWSLSLPQFLDCFRDLLGAVDEAAWDALREEATQAELTQRAAYSAAAWKEAPSSYLDYEGWTPEGHNLHPGAKTRQGFTLGDQLAYGPEFSERVDLPWVAISKSLLRFSGTLPACFELDAQTWAVPVHPWQLENLLPSVYKAEWEAGKIRPLQRPPIASRPCTSLRTLVPEDSEFPVLKLSVGSLMTSTERSMSGFTVMQGPVYTEYFRRLAKEEPALFQKVRPMAEFGGLCWFEMGSSRSARNLSLLCRQRPPEVAEGSVAVPCSALPQPLSPGHSQTVLAKLLGVGEAALQNFRTYLELVIPFHLQLYLRHGLALEAHLQNCVVVWGASGPEELWVRDWGGLRADAKVLAQKAPDLLARLDAKSVTLADAETAESKLIACLCCNHLTELVSQAVQGCGLEEEALWAEVARVMREALRGHEESRLAARLLEEAWPVKCLLRMRLGQGGGGDLYHHRRNPL